MNTIFFVFLSTLILGVNCVVVQLKDGAINGTTTKTNAGRSFHKFLGIPYAKPPTKKLRFQPPVPVNPWTGIKDVTQPPPKCVQWTFPDVPPITDVGQEDCLYLNVFVPKELLNSSRKAPVIVGIHGSTFRLINHPGKYPAAVGEGAFQTGSANDYDGDYFMDRDVIFVSINYRLGVLGFLAINDITSDMNNDVVSGNFGLKDQALALQWVNKNIAQFGGDPNNVTLMGQGAGAAAVHFHMFSPFSKGLFQKAIMESGNAFAFWARFPTKEYDMGWGEDKQRMDQVVASLFLKDSRCDWNYTNQLDCLQNIPIEEFTKPGGGLQKFNEFLPVIEQNVTKSLAFFPDEPDSSNYLTMVPWLSGINSGDGAAIVSIFLRDGSRLAKIINSEKAYLSYFNNYLYTANQSDVTKITQAVNNFYFGNEKIGLETAHYAVDMITDSNWLYPFKSTVKSGPNEQYLYLYDHRGTFSNADLANLTIDLGVSHGDELPLLVPVKSLEAKRSLKDRRVSDTCLKYWINFAISGDPNRHSKEKVWQPMQTKDESFEYLHIKSDGVVMKKDLYADRYNFWKSLPTGFQ